VSRLDADTVGETESTAANAVRIAAPALPGGLARVARADVRRLSPQDVLSLQRAVGNRAVAKMVQRYGTGKGEDQRPMMDKGGKTDEPWVGPEGDRFVWDPFDRTLTIFTSENGPNAGKAIQMTYRDGTPDELAKLPTDKFYERVEVLSPVRAAALEFLRTEQGKYQESEADRASRVETANASGKRTTLCNSHTGKFGAALAGAKANLGGFDPRAEAIKGQRGGAFHTLESHPSGPKPGDIYSCGIVTKPTKKDGLRTANFFTTTHVGVFKSRRPGPNGAEIWTVVDGGQGTFEGRQETRERTRIFQRERLEISIPKKIASNGNPLAWENKPVEMECGVLHSKLADAGQGADDKLLRGWLDIDEYFGDDKSVPTQTGANNAVFVGNAASAASPASNAPASTVVST
jgi:hypothetical protein